MKNTTSSTPLRDDKLVTLAVDPASSAMTVQQVLGQVALIQQIMGTAMKDGEHFGRIPGCGDKPTLLKPGAEKLCLTFRLAPTYELDERNYDRDHREYRVQCTFSSILTGSFLGQGVGTCSTMEGEVPLPQGAGRADRQAGAPHVLGYARRGPREGAGADRRQGFHVARSTARAG